MRVQYVKMMMHYTCRQPGTMHGLHSDRTNKTRQPSLDSSLSRRYNVRPVKHRPISLPLAVLHRVLQSCAAHPGPPADSVTSTSSPSSITRNSHDLTTSLALTYSLQLVEKVTCQVSASACISSLHLCISFSGNENALSAFILHHVA